MGSFDFKIFDGRELLPSLDETLKALFDLSLADLAVVVGAALWLVLLILSLKAIDRRDQITGLTYILFMSAAGAMLVLALPARLSGSHELTSRQVLQLVAMAALAGVRWAWRGRPPTRAAMIINDGKEGSA